MEFQIDIPKELESVFRRVLHMAPESKRNTKEYQKLIIAFIKVGGIKLAKHYILISQCKCDNPESIVKLPSETEDLAEGDDLQVEDNDSTPEE